MRRRREKEEKEEGKEKVDIWFIFMEIFQRPQRYSHTKAIFVNLWSASSGMSDLEHRMDQSACSNISIN